MKPSILSISLALLALHVVCCSSFAAEFSEGDIAPQIETFILTEGLIAVAVSAGYQIPEWEKYPRFFAADRSGYNFKRISEEEFSRIRSMVRYERRFRTYPVTPDGQAEMPSWREVSPEKCSSYDYESGAKTTRVFGSEDLRVSVELSCRSFVSRALSVENEVWIATLRGGEFGYLAAFITAFRA